VAPERFLLTVSGRDRPGLAGELFSSLRAVAAEITDVGQITIRGHLVLCVEVEALEGVGPAELEAAVAASAIEADGAISIDVGPITERVAPEARRLAITLVAPSIDAEQLAGVFGSIARCGGDCERIVRLARYPVQSYELIVRGTDHEQLRTALGEIAVSLNLDIAVQRAGLGRRAKRLIVMDADSTLIQGEVIDRLAARLGLEEKVAAITEAAMAGALDFAAALEERVALLAGLSADDVTAVSSELQLMPGARTLVRTLQRLGFQTAVVSGGFLEVLRPLLDELGIHRAAANALEVVDGRLTGRLAGPVVDRAAKAEALRRFAEELDVPIAQTVAVGDGANDIDMLTAAGLGIAFNAHPAVREAADTALSVPYLDAVLFLLGISREEIEAADADDL
jgi:phosphoserine phosphatase